MDEEIRMSHRGYNVYGYRGGLGKACASAIRGDTAVIIMTAETDDITPSAMVDRVMLAIDAAMFPVYYPRGESF